MTPVQVLQWLIEIPGTLDDELRQFDELSVDDLARIACTIREVRAELAITLEATEQSIATELAPRPRKPVKYVVPGLGELTARCGVKRDGWQKDELVSVVVQRICDEIDLWCDPDTGERHPPPETGARLARRLNECIAFGDPKVTGLRKLGLDPTEFCRETPEAASVQLPPRDTTPTIREQAQ